MGLHSAAYRIVNVNNSTNTVMLSCLANVVEESQKKSAASRALSFEDDDNGVDVLASSFVELGDLYCGRKKVQ
jgi:hypothetical protein